MSHLKLADFSDQRTGESTALVAKQFAFENPSGRAAQLTAMNGRCPRDSGYG